MLPPDLEQLARSTRWPLQDWTDAWQFVTGEFPEHRWPEVWRYVEQLAPHSQPVTSAHAIKAASIEPPDLGPWLRESTGDRLARWTITGATWLAWFTVAALTVAALSTALTGDTYQAAVTAGRAVLFAVLAWSLRRLPAWVNRLS